MRRLLVTLILVFTTIEVSPAQQATFDEATLELTSGDLNRARTLFRELEMDGHHAPELFWNQALVALETDSIGLAKFYLMRAAQYPEFRANARNGLTQLETRFSRRSSVLPALPWNQFLDYLRYQWGANTLLWVSLILLNLTALVWVTLLVRNTGGRFTRTVLYLTAVFAALLFLSSTVLELRENRTTTGIHTGTQTPVYQQPNSESAVVATLYEGYIVTLPTSATTDTTSYYPVWLENGMSGWVSPEQIRTFQGTP